MHILQQQASYIVEALKTLSFHGGNVFRRRLYELQNRELPACLLTVENESINEEAGKNRNYQIFNRVTSWQIAAIIKVKATGEETENHLFDILKELENLLTGFDFSDPEVAPFQFVNINNINFEISGQADTPVGALIVNFTTISKTRAGQSTVPLT